MGDVNVALRVTMQLNKSGAVYSVLGYLEQGAVVAGKALVLQGDVDALPGPQVDAGVRKALPHLQQVLLHRGGGPRQGLEVAPLLHAGDHTGGGGGHPTLHFHYHFQISPENGSIPTSLLPSSQLHWDWE